MSMRFTWPWGRLTPAKRLEELDRLISKHRSTMRIIQSQAQEALRLQERSIEALVQQRRIVETFLDEDKRRAILQRAYELEALGIPVLDKIAAAETLDDIEAILEQAASESSDSDLQNTPLQPNILDQDVPDLFGSDITDNLFEKGEEA
jgi:hypothetical protein